MLPLVLPSQNEMHAQLDIGQVTDMTIAEHSTSLPQTSLGLLSNILQVIVHLDSEALYNMFL